MRDLISRQDAIHALIEWYGCEPSDLDYFKKIVEKLPSAQPEHRWIPVKTRPMDEEEKQYWEEHYGYKFGEDFDGIMFDCSMPEDGEEVWVCSKCGNVWQDVCEVDEGIGLEGNGDWEDIVAWMPFIRPEPYKGEDE